MANYQKIATILTLNPPREVHKGEQVRLLQSVKQTAQATADNDISLEELRQKLLDPRPQAVLDI